MFLLVPAYLGSPGQKAVKRLCVCVCVITQHYEHASSQHNADTALKLHESEAMLWYKMVNYT